MDFDGKNNKKIYELKESTNSVCLLKDWVFFIDSDEDSMYMDIVSPDGKQHINLITLDFADYYYLEDLLEERKNEIAEGEENSSGEDTNNQVENNNVSNEVQN